MKLQYQIENGHLTIEEFLKKQHFSKNLISALKYQGGEILVFNEPKYVNYKLNNGDMLTIVLPKEEMNENVIRTKMDLEIIYEDEHLLIVNKEAGIPTIPSKRHYDMSLANGIMYYYETKGIEANIHFVNRLDKDTSGLLIVAKNRFIHHLFDHHTTITKKYLAIVQGIVSNQVIEANIKRESVDSHKRMVDPNGDYAKTVVKLVKEKAFYSLVELELLTGRTHQIRVHLSFIGHPLLGDSLYGGNQDLMKRQALHSYYLSFIHPVTNILMNFETVLPMDMLEIIK